MTDPTAPRPRCYRCMRPSTMCLCSSVPVIPTRTSVVVLQHPHERTHPFGTARLVKLGMPNSVIHTVVSGFDRDLHCPLELPDDAILLYPHPEAEDLTGLDAGDRPSTLVVLDGTWSHAKQLYRDNPWLQRLRHVRITPDAPSRYRIRKEPQPDYISTLEAIVLALRALEPDAPDFDPLLAAFDGMIDRQLDHRLTGVREPRSKRPRQKPSRRVSPLVHEPGLVVLYAESSLPGGDKSGRRQLVQLAAARPGGGDTFETILRPAERMPATAHLGHMGLTTAQLEAGDTIERARQRFRAFVGDDPIASWTPNSLAWAAPLLPDGARTALLKTSYCNLQNRRAGYLEDALAREGLSTRTVACHGRAAGRLGSALALAAWLRERDEGARPCS